MKFKNYISCILFFNDDFKNFLNSLSDKEQIFFIKKTNLIGCGIENKSLLRLSKSFGIFLLCQNKIINKEKVIDKLFNSLLYFVFNNHLYSKGLFRVFITLLNAKFAAVNFFFFKFLHFTHIIIVLLKLCKK